MLYGALVVTMDMLRRLINCRYIIVIVFYDVMQCIRQLVSWL